MATLFYYSVLGGMLLLVLYIVYRWAMASENQHGFNRAVILGIYSFWQCVRESWRLAPQVGQSVEIVQFGARYAGGHQRGQSQLVGGGVVLALELGCGQAYAEWRRMALQRLA